MLKKIALTIAAVAVMAAAAVAAPVSGNTMIDAVPGINFKTSTNVKVVYIPDLVNTTAHQTYALVSKHTSGDTYYAGSNLSTTIMKQQASANIGVVLTTSNVPTGVTAGETVYTGWTAM